MTSFPLSLRVVGEVWQLMSPLSLLPAVFSAGDLRHNFQGTASCQCDEAVFTFLRITELWKVKGVAALEIVF